MKHTKEIIKNGNQSIVEVHSYELNEFGAKINDVITAYVVCKDYDGSKVFGKQYNGYEAFTYSTISRGADEALEYAVKRLYGVVEPRISFERMESIISLLVERIFEDDEEDAVEFLKETVDITEDEAEHLNIKEKLYPVRYKIVEVELERVQKQTIKICVPEDTCSYDLLDNIYLDDLEPEWGDEGNWDLYDSYDIENDLSQSEVEEKYDSDDIYNYDDFAE